MDKQKMRLGLYRKIEIARKQLPQMDEEAFRALLRSEFGVESRKNMNVHQLSRLVQLFAEQYGVTYTAPAKSRTVARTGSRSRMTCLLPPKSGRFWRYGGSWATP